MKLVLDHIRVRHYLPSDEAVWLCMRLELWPDSDRAEALAWALRRDVVTLVAENARTYKLVGFAEVGKRLYADGCQTSPVAFLEGWYVSTNSRGAGVGLKLVQAAGMWAKSQGLQELASDSLLYDELAYRAHIAAGFEEVERSIKYRLSCRNSLTSRILGRGCRLLAKVCVPCRYRAASSKSSESHRKASERPFQRCLSSTCLKRSLLIKEQFHRLKQDSTGWRE